MYIYTYTIYICTIYVHIYIYYINMYYICTYIYLAVGTLTELKCIHARVQVRQAVFIHLHAVVGDDADGVLLSKILESQCPGMFTIFTI